MIIAITLIIVILAGVSIFQIRRLTGRITIALHKNNWIDQNLKFQVTQVLLALVVLALVYWINPQNFISFFRFGNIHTHISKVAWLGITGSETWLEIATSIGVFITLGTGIFMFFLVKKVKAKFRPLLFALPWVILFSAMNAFSEEAIFRIGIVSPLFGQLSIPIILIISALIFGLPHYFGQPSGIIGAIMAGFLGWLLAMSLVETQGLFLAWVIHFVQDVIIISSIFMINNSRTGTPSSHSIQGS